MREPDRHPRELLEQHADGSLDREAAQRVKDHLAGCPSCTRELETWRGLYSGLARLPRPATPPALRLRILEAVARESARRRVRAQARRRRLVAALSWSYAAGIAVVAALGLGLAFVPEVRHAAGSAIAMATAAGLQAGLTVVDGLSLVSAGADSVLRFLGDQLSWVETLGRALGTAGGAAGQWYGIWITVLVGVVFFSLMFVRFLHQREPQQEVPHVGPMLA